MSSTSKNTQTKGIRYFQLLFLAFLFLIALQTSCSIPTELNGEIFVVTKGAGNYKLGAIEVLAVPESQFLEFATGKRAEKEKWMSYLKSKIKECGNFGFTYTEVLKYENCLTEYEDGRERLGNIYFEGMPTPIATAVTNGDGKFTLKLPHRDKYIILARAARKTLQVTERYFWFVPFEAQEAQQNIILSNNNMYEPETAPF